MLTQEVLDPNPWWLDQYREWT